MGYDLYIWKEPRPTNYKSGLSILNKLGELDGVEYEANKALWNVREINPVFVEFYEKLTLQYPCISSDDPRAEDSPWKFGPLIDAFRGRVVHLSWVWTNWEETLAFVLSTASNSGLYCLDDQQGRVVYPEDDIKVLIESQESKKNMQEINNFQKAFEQEIYRRAQENDWEGWQKTGTFTDEKSGMIVTATSIHPKFRINHTSEIETQKFTMLERIIDQIRIFFKSLSRKGKG
jgi:enolase